MLLLRSSPLSLKSSSSSSGYDECTTAYTLNEERRTLYMPAIAQSRHSWSFVVASFVTSPQPPTEMERGREKGEASCCITCPVNRCWDGYLLFRRSSCVLTPTAPYSSSEMMTGRQDLSRRRDVSDRLAEIGSKPLHAKWIGLEWVVWMKSSLWDLLTWATNYMSKVKPIFSLIRKNNSTGNVMLMNHSCLQFDTKSLLFPDTTASYYKYKIVTRLDVLKS